MIKVMIEMGVSTAVRDVWNDGFFWHVMTGGVSFNDREIFSSVKSDCSALLRS